MTTGRYRLAIVIGSVRHGRFGVTVAHWFVRHAAQRDNIDIDVIDLADYQHPVDMTDHPDTRRFAGQVAAADAVVIVTPEYNHSYPGPLKTAIDSVRAEWRGKPVGFVSYGGLSGGLRAVEALRAVFAELHATTIRDTVSFHNAWDQFDHAGHAQPGPADKAAAALLDQLGWWAPALRDARIATPYPA